MTELREKVLYEWLKETFISIQKSQETNKEMGLWERNIMKVNEDKIEEVCRKIARNINKFVEDEKRKGREATPNQIKRKASEELNNL